MIKIPDQLMAKLAPAVLIVKKHSPHILFGAGVVGVATSTVLACRATLRVGDELDQTQNRIQAIKSDALQPYLSNRHSSVADPRREIAIEYTRGVFAITKLYAPAVLVGGLSIAALTGSHIQLTRRNSALTAAYVAIEKEFNEYRMRVREELGEERELELYHKGKFETIEGERVLKLNEDGSTLYSRVFDESNRNWVPNAESNRTFLEAQQRYFNDRLMAYKHVFLNDIYDNLGFERTSEGQLFGWVYPSDNGDNFIDFGMYNCINADFVINGDRSVLLDFNTQGIIYNLI